MFLSHSKYETVTPRRIIFYASLINQMNRFLIPPELAKISGITMIFFSKRIFSAAGVVGPLAPSTISFALILPALAFVITFSLAAGIKISHSCSNRSPSYFLAPGNPTILPENQVL